MKWSILLSLFTFSLRDVVVAQVEPPCNSLKAFNAFTAALRDIRITRTHLLRYGIYNNAFTISTIYCTGRMLETIQMAELYKDSKTFVDMSIKEGNTPQSVLAAFDELMDPSKDELRRFVETYFVEGNEFEYWRPQDWMSNPAFLDKIQDPKLYTFGSKLNQFWNQLGRKIKKEVKLAPERFSIIYVSNGIVIPGGRFREFYYWDSYWIQIGLLHSQMNLTVRGMIDNFLEIVEHEDYGFVPNGGRIYYRRSQPPLLIPMVRNYVNYLRGTGDTAIAVPYLKQILPTLEKEFKFWIDNRMVTVTDQNNNLYQLAIYNSTRDEPRPESFREDYELAHNLTDLEKMKLYTNLHSGAESGWDFSSRWWDVPEGETASLVHTRTTNIIPSDLNAFLYLDAVLLSQFYREVGNTVKAKEFDSYASQFREAIMGILWDEEQGSWFDYDLEKGQRRRRFYMSNIVPLWAGVDDSKVDRLVKYLGDKGALKYAGGIPTSLKMTGEQWDFPNGWAPLEHLVVDALAKSNSKAAQELAFDIAQKWTLGNFKLYDKKGIMMEKYDVTAPGTAGGGGEYDVVIGFGWSNGVILDFLARYGGNLKVPKDLGSGTSNAIPITLPFMFIGSLVISIQRFV